MMQLGKQIVALKFIKRTLIKNISFLNPRGAKQVLSPLFFCAFLMLSQVLVAEVSIIGVPIVEVSDNASTVAPAQIMISADNNILESNIVEDNATSSPNLLSELYYQVQNLQQEVIELRGLVEQQNHHLQKLKQQRLDDYIDLDRRISNDQNNAGQEIGAQKNFLQNKDSLASQAALKTWPKKVGLERVSSPLNPEKSHYEEAYNFLKQRQVDRSVEAFRQHVITYPAGEYTPNAH